MPTVLGHGALFKNDLAASFGFVWFWYGCWRYWRSPSAGNAALLSAALLMAILAKMSMLVLLPAAPLVIALRHRTEAGGAWRAIRRLALVGAVVYAGTAAAYQFQLSPVARPEIQSWKADPAIPRWIPAAAKLAGKIPSPVRLREGAVSLILLCYK
jgi:hypothetical protein